MRKMGCPNRSDRCNPNNYSIYEFCILCITFFKKSRDRAVLAMLTYVNTTISLSHIMLGTAWDGGTVVDEKTVGQRDSRIDAMENQG